MTFFFRPSFSHVTAYGPQLKTEVIWQEEEEQEEMVEEEQIRFRVALLLVPHPLTWSLHIEDNHVLHITAAVCVAGY